MSWSQDIKEFEISSDPIIFHESVERGSAGNSASNSLQDLIAVDEENILETSHSLRTPKPATNKYPPISPTLIPSQPPRIEKSPPILPMKKTPKITPLRGLEWSARMIGLGDPDPDHGDSSGDEDDAVEIGKGHAVAGTATLEEHLLMRALEKDIATLVILQADSSLFLEYDLFIFSSKTSDPCLQVTSSMESFMRTDMNRLDLLTACRRAAVSAPFNPRRQRPAAAGLKSGEEAAAAAAAAAAAGWDPYGHHTLGAPVQLRDIRCLQVTARHLVRRMPCNGFGA
jgi:hypothetical protein